MKYFVTLDFDGRSAIPSADMLDVDSCWSGNLNNLCKCSWAYSLSLSAQVALESEKLMRTGKSHHFVYLLTPRLVPSFFHRF